LTTPTLKNDEFKIKIRLKHRSRPAYPVSKRKPLAWLKEAKQVQRHPKQADFNVIFMSG
jgi:hypothetical protein